MVEGIKSIPLYYKKFEIEGICGGIVKPKTLQFECCFGIREL
jgi:hypothetical protein